MPESKYLNAAPIGTAYASSVGVDTNSTTTAQDKIDKTATALEAGDYLINCYAEGKTDTPDTSGCKIEVLLNGVAKAETTIKTDDWHDFSASAVIVFSEGDTPRIQLQFKRAGASATVSIRRAYISLVPIAKVTS